MLKIGDRVRKRTGDYSFEGFVVAAFRKMSETPEGEPLLNAGPVRYVVQNQAGILHIFNGEQLESPDSPSP